jgi:hypothetical protein
MDHGLLGTPEKVDINFYVLYKDSSSQAAMISIHTILPGWIYMVSSTVSSDRGMTINVDSRDHDVALPRKLVGGPHECFLI